MRDLLLSIRPRWAQLIFDGVKTLEYRRGLPQPYYDIHRIWIYATKPVGLVLGTAEVSVWAGDVYDLSGHNGCLTREQYERYFRGAKVAYGMIIKSVDRFERPLRLEEICVRRAPQSWMYVPGDVFSWSMDAFNAQEPKVIKNDKDNGYVATPFTGEWEIE